MLALLRGKSQQLPKVIIEVLASGVREGRGEGRARTRVLDWLPKGMCRVRLGEIHHPRRSWHLVSNCPRLGLKQLKKWQE